MSSITNTQYLKLIFTIRNILCIIIEPIAIMIDSKYIKKEELLGSPPALTDSPTIVQAVSYHSKMEIVINKSDL